MTRYNQTVDNLINSVGRLSESQGVGLDSTRSLEPHVEGTTGCSSVFRDEAGHCYKYQQQYLNVGAIRNQGWELQGSMNLGPLTTRGTYSWIKSRVIGVTPRYRYILDDEKFTPGLPFDFLPEHTWALGLTYSHSQSFLSLSVNGVAQRYISRDDVSDVVSNARINLQRPRFSLSSGTQVPYRPIGFGYATADLNGTHRFSSRIDVTLNVNNLTNQYRSDVSTSDATAGRQTRLGLRLRLQ